MSQGITSRGAFDPSQATVTDDRSVFQKARLTHILQVLEFNNIPHKANITKNVALSLIDGIYASGGRLNVPLPGGGSAPMKVENQRILPPEIKKTVSRPQPPQVPTFEDFEGAPDDDGSIQDADIGDKVYKLKHIKFMKLRHIAKHHGMECPSGMSPVEKDALCKQLAAVVDPSEI